MSLKLARKKDSHKGNNGEVLVVGGSELYTGAPALSALSAMRTGVDLTYIAAPKRAADICAGFSPNLITIPLQGRVLNETHMKAINKWLARADVMLIGPGLGKNKETFNAVYKLIQNCKKPIVIDGDGLKAVAKKLDVLKNKKVVLTPHKKEFETLTGTKPTTENAKKFASENKIILLKAPQDIITNGKTVKINKTGNPGMTVGGTGDVLSGIVSGLIAQKVGLFDAAFEGAEICGRAGDLCYKEYGNSLLATDLIERIPRVMRQQND